MLGRSGRESGAIARLAATLGGWRDEQDEDLLDLGTTSQALMTIGSIDDLAAVLHIGHPSQPAHSLEQRLLQAPASVMLTAAVAVPPSWAWVGRQTDARGTLVVDDAGIRDCRGTLRDLGVAPHLVPSAMPVEQRLALAGPDGSLVIERSRIPSGYVELPGSALLPDEPVWYGLARAVRRGGERDVVVDGPSQVWLAFGPSDDHLGSLGESLRSVAGAGFDLQHLRSQRSTAGLHVFYTSFACADRSSLTALLSEFDGRGVRHRVLAVLPGSSFLPGPDPVEPQWAAR